MVGRLVSFWDSFLAGAMLVSGSVDYDDYIDAFDKELFKGIYVSVIFQVMCVFKLSSNLSAAGFTWWIWMDLDD